MSLDDSSCVDEACASIERLDLDRQGYAVATENHRLLTKLLVATQDEFRERKNERRLLAFARICDLATQVRGLCPPDVVVRDLRALQKGHITAQTVCELIVALERLGSEHLYNRSRDAPAIYQMLIRELVSYGVGSFTGPTRLLGVARLYARDDSWGLPEQLRRPTV